jgi:aryl sulfotransferase
VTRRIWLASYPKSGNTWLRMLIANLAAKDDRPVGINDAFGSSGIASARGPFDRLLLIDSGLLTHDEADCLRPLVYEELARGLDDDERDPREAPPAVRFVKVHDAYTLTPLGEPLLAGARGADGAIVIVRDPRDVAPSLAGHRNTGIDDAIAFMNDRDAEFSANTTRQDSQLRQKLPGWSGHITSWLDQTDIPIHLVRYEDLQIDTAAVLRRALQFAGQPATDDELFRAVRFADFTRLRQQEEEKGFKEAPQHLGERFFRRGEAGGWRDELTPDQAARIVAAHGAVMRRLGYDVTLAPLAAQSGAAGERDRADSSAIRQSG